MGSYVLLFISRYGNNFRGFVIRSTSNALTWQTAEREREKETMIYFVYSKSPFGYLLSIIYGSYPFFFPTLPPSFTCRSERHKNKILEHEPNISLPRLFFAPDKQKT